MGWLILIGVGAVLWWWSLGLTLRAYRGERMPMWGTQRKAPRRAVALRACSVAAVTFGGAMFGATAGQPAGVAALSVACLVALLLFPPHIVAVARHNRRAGVHPFG